MYENLVKEAFEAMKSAYAPYSNYHVGACVLCKDGRTFRGVNIENASYGATNCAERSAVFAAYSYGYRKNEIEGAQRAAEQRYPDHPVQRQGNHDDNHRRTAADELWHGGSGMKSGFVALIGRPNAGKSTLLNALVQQKVAIISPKPQTTRNSIRAIRTDDDSQIIFVDTPGIHKPKHELGTQMNKEAYSAAAGVDLIYYLVDGSVPFGSGDEFVLNTLRQMHLPVYLILNKIDLLEKEQLIELLLQWQKRMDFKEIIPISAKTQNNLDQLIEVTKNDLTDGVQYYPADQVCDYPEQFIMAEIIRDKVLMLTEEEVPHSVAVVIERIRKNREHLIIHAMILVERDSQKGIIIGKQGRMIKQIGMLAREELQGLLGEPIFLELFVRVEKDWRNKRAKLQQLGYIQTELEDE